MLVIVKHAALRGRGIPGCKEKQGRCRVAFSEPNEQKALTFRATGGHRRIFRGTLTFFFFAKADAFGDGCGKNGFAWNHAAGATGHAVGFQSQAILVVGAKVGAGKTHRATDFIRRRAGAP